MGAAEVLAAEGVGVGRAVEPPHGAAWEGVLFAFRAKANRG